MRSRDAHNVVDNLRAKLEEDRRRRARQAGWTRRLIPTGLALLDEVLPQGGIPAGAITEILGDGKGSGALSLAMRLALRCTWSAGDSGTEAGANVVVVDTAGDFYPPAAWQRGLSPHQLVVIRAGDAKAALWSVEQSLRCPAIAVVVALMNSLDVRQSRRLQLAAESSGCVGLLLRGDRRRVRSFAAVRMLVEGVPWGDASGGDQRMVSGDTRLCRITLLKVREGAPAGPLLVDLDHETGACAIPAIPVDRPAARLA